MGAALVSIGEVALLHAVQVPSGVVLLVQAMTAEPSSSQTQAQAASQVWASFTTVMAMSIQGATLGSDSHRDACFSSL